MSPAFGIFVTCIEPGAVGTELTNSITDKELMNDMQDKFSEMTFLESEDIANAIHYAVSQGEQVNVNELQVRPVMQG